MTPSEANSASVSKSIAQKSGSNFLYAFLFLPKAQRDAIRTVYAFARQLDDSVDEVAESAEQRRRIAGWKEEIDLCYQGAPSLPVTKELARTIKRYSMPREYFEELIRGCEMDIEQTCYESYEELRHYCYRVASVVGLICLKIFGCRHPDSEPYAVALGQALQMTNILRDVGADARRGRIYLPQEDLKRFGYSSEELMRQTHNEAFVKLMNFKAERAEGLYREAARCLPREERRRLIAARMMGRIYHALLDKIVRDNYPVFASKVSLGKAHKIGLALQTYFGLGERSQPSRS